MIVITAKFRVLPEYTDQWPQISHDFTQGTRAEPGCKWYDWSRSLDDPTEYVLVEAFRDEEAGVASARSAFLVLQQTPSLPLQPVVTGRYYDRFARREGAWQFAQRHIIVDHIGEVREHLAFDLAAFRAEHPG